MASIADTVRARLAAFFALEDDWARPTPRVGRADVLVSLVVGVIGLVALELSRSAGALHEVPAPWWVQYLVVTAGASALVWRRRYPLTVALALAAHMFVTGASLGPLMSQLALQLCYFVGIFSAVAWGRSRRTSLLVAGGIVGFMLCWVAWQFAVGAGVQEYLDEVRAGEDEGLWPAVPSAVALTFVVNIIYFLGAVVGGQVAWRGARQRERLTAQARTIADQSDSLRRRAVMDERLRIARELHDVVGHHVSVIGVQATGARRVLAQDPDEASTALAAIEESSREAVTQMRALLGTLRDPDALDDPTALSRTSGPGLAELPALVESRSGDRLRATYHLVEDLHGAVARVPTPTGLSLYRTAQEALANVTRHSTAAEVSVTLRVTERGAHPFVEVEVLDDGRPRAQAPGSGVGLLGIRERTASHRGECEIGPRVTHGFRVRVRLPLGPTGAEPEPAPPEVVRA